MCKKLLLRKSTIKMLMLAEESINVKATVLLYGC